MHQQLPYWQPPHNYQQVASTLEGITVYAPKPESTDVDARTNFKCPHCGATTRYDIAAGGVACEHCGHVATPQAQHVGRQAKAFEFTMTSVLRSTQGWGVARKELHCDHCGADLAITDASISTTCPFCASNHVNIRIAASEKMRPRFLVPFIVQQNTAQKSVREWLGKGWMHPAKLSSAASLKYMQGIYVPFWTFDANITSEWRGEVGYTKTRTHRDSNGQTHTTTTIEWRWENGKATTIIDDLLISGSSHVNDIILQRIHPFDLSHLVSYTPDYLAGWQAQAYDVRLMDAWDNAKKIMRERAKASCFDQISTNRVRNFSMSAEFGDENWRYILLPIYITAYTFKGETYQLMVNGQSGKVAGQKPVAWWKIWVAVITMLIPGILSIGTFIILTILEELETERPIFFIVGIILLLIAFIVSGIITRKAMDSEAG